ncbi:MAG: DUF4112 domain-containing protein [Myxococcales bacterium]|nr:DUF4112 domain-containing protein [Myxococcales bacterium]
MPRAKPHTPSYVQHPQLATAKRLVGWLDTAHLDAVIGLVIPGAGDIIGSVVGLYLVRTAVVMKTSPAVIARMLLNLALDTVIGLVPFFGDVADLAFRSHKRNLALLERSVGRGGKASPSDWLWVVGAALLFVAAAAAVTWTLIAFWRWVF